MTQHNMRFPILGEPMKVVELEGNVVVREWPVDIPDDIRVQRFEKKDGYFILKCYDRNTGRKHENQLVAYIDLQGQYLPHGTECKFFDSTGYHNIVDPDEEGYLCNCQDKSVITIEHFRERAIVNMFSVRLPGKSIDRHIIIRGNTCLLRCLVRMRLTRQEKRERHGSKHRMYSVFSFDDLLSGQAPQFIEGRPTVLDEERGGHIRDNNEIIDPKTLNRYRLPIQGCGTLEGFAVSQSGHKVVYAGTQYEFIYECFMFVFDPNNKLIANKCVGLSDDVVIGFTPDNLIMLVHDAYDVNCGRYSFDYSCSVSVFSLDLKTEYKMRGGFSSRDELEELCKLPYQQLLESSGKPTTDYQELRKQHENDGWW